MTKVDLLKLFEECKQEISSADIEIGEIENVIINKRAVRRWGQCKKLDSGKYEIEISYRILTDKTPIKAVKQVIIHELLHSIPGAHGHRGKWLFAINKMNRTYGYTMKRTAVPEDFNLDNPLENGLLNFKYAVQCTNCKTISYRNKMTRAVAHPERYYCGKCRTASLVRIK